MIILVAVIVHLLLCFLPTFLMYRLTKKYSSSFWRIFIQCFLVGTFPLGMLLYIHGMHGITLDDVKTLGIVWVILQVILGIWTVSKYK